MALVPTSPMQAAYENRAHDIGLYHTNLAWPLRSKPRCPIETSRGDLPLLRPEMASIIALWSDRGEAAIKVANTVELKNRTNKLLRQVMQGESVIVTYRGKPAAALTPLSEDDLEDFVLEHSPKIRRLIARAEADRKAGRVVSLDAYLESAPRR
jgi:prevent-host-death family protein